MGSKVSKKYKKRLERILRNASNLKPVLRKIGMDMKKETLSNIDNERSYKGTPWKKSNRAITEGGKTLQNTRRLYNSITFRVISGDTVICGTKVKYARALNRGVNKGAYGRKNVRVKAHQRRNKNGTISRVKTHYKSINLPWGEIPKYEYLGKTPEMLRRYRNYLRQHLLK